MGRVERSTRERRTAQSTIVGTFTMVPPPASVPATPYGRTNGESAGNSPPSISSFCCSASGGGEFSISVTLSQSTGSPPRSTSCKPSTHRSSTRTHNCSRMSIENPDGNGSAGLPRSSSASGRRKRPPSGSPSTGIRRTSLVSLRCRRHRSARIDRASE